MQAHAARQAPSQRLENLGQSLEAGLTAVVGVHGSEAPGRGQQPPHWEHPTRVHGRRLFKSARSFLRVPPGNGLVGPSLVGYGFAPPGHQPQEPLPVDGAAKAQVCAAIRKRPWHA